MLFLLFLGFWQLHRADEKEQILAAAKAHTEMQPTRWTAEFSRPQVYQRVVLEGVYDQETLFLDNQYYHHQFGYDVLHPFQMTDGRWVLIDRGWIPVSVSDRTHLPSVLISQGTQRLEGYVYYPSDKSMILGEWLDLKQGHRFLVEKLDISATEKLLHHHLMPFIIRLDKPKEPGYVRDWPLVSMAPNRHVAYAVQWFLMAFVLVVIYCVLNFRNRNL